MISVRKAKATIEGKKERDELRNILLRFVAKCILGNSLQTLLLLVILNSGRSENAKVMVDNLRSKLIGIFWRPYKGPYYNCSKSEYLRAKYMYEAEQNRYLKTTKNSDLITILWQNYSMKLSHALRFKSGSTTVKNPYKHPQMGILNIGGPARREWWLVFNVQILYQHPEVIWHDPEWIGNLFQLCVAVVGADVVLYRAYQDAELTYVWEKPMRVALIGENAYVEVTDLVPDAVGGGFPIRDKQEYKEGANLVGFVLGLGTGYMDYSGKSPHFSIPDEGATVPTTGLKRYIEAEWIPGLTEEERKEYSGGLYWIGTRFPSYGEYGGLEFVYADRRYIAQELAKWPDDSRGDGITLLKKTPIEDPGYSVKKNLEKFVEKNTFVPSILEKDR